jgi:UDP-4-amino-4,6-dideoxy-N-acetyl-beta-L-altrosamine transaminase
MIIIPERQGVAVLCLQREARTMGEIIYPYGHQNIDEDDVAAVVAALKSDWLTMGPAVGEFEDAVANYTGARHAVAYCNGTAALHGAMYASGVTQGDLVLVPSLTFAATGNSAVFCGGRPIFADISPDTLCMSPESAEAALASTTSRVRAIAPVSFAGYPADIEAFRQLAERYGAVLIEDGAHALGASRGSRMVGSEADMTELSFHPVKHITTAEGGMVVTDSDEYASRLRLFRNHGIARPPMKIDREYNGPWDNDMIELGYNYRLPDICCALGTSQMKRLDLFVARRREIASLYRKLFADEPGVTLPPDCPGHSYHLFVIQVESRIRRSVFEFLRESGIGVQLHYVPLHLHSYYRRSFGTKEGDCPATEAYSSKAMSLPMYAGLTDDGAVYTADKVKKAIAKYS